jgi:hypothetical protein
MAKSGLEERLEAITLAFVAQIVATFRDASLADLAELQFAGPRERTGAGGGGASGKKPVTRVTASPRAQVRSNDESSRPRQTADRRAELGERVIKVLEKAGEPLGVRALSSELGVATDLLAAPLLELRASGRIAKHGEKRATTYSVA